MTGTSTERTAGRPVAPPEIRTLAHERRTARLARDWATADRLKTEIEAAGWRVVDRGPDFALVPALPPDLERDGRVLYGAPERVPSLLDTPPVPGSTLVVLGDDVATVGEEIVPLAGTPSTGELAEAGLRRVATEWAVLVPAGVAEVGSAWFTALSAAIDAGLPSEVAAIGAFGARTRDLHGFAPVAEGDADVLLAGPIAARREDLAGLAPFERRIVSPDRFAQWLTLALRRDTPRADDDTGPRRAVVVAGAAADVAERRAAEASADRLAKRDFYRILDRFGLDPDLLTSEG